MALRYTASGDEGADVAVPGPVALAVGVPGPRMRLQMFQTRVFFAMESLPMKSSVVRIVTLTLPLVLVIAAACQKAPAPAGSAAENKPVPSGQEQTPAAVQPAASPLEAEMQKAVMTYIQTVRHVNTDKMTVTVSDIKAEGDKATCTVSYGLKEGQMPPMVYLYDLARQNGTWTVTASRPKGGEGHAGDMNSGAGLPPGHPSVGEAPPPMEPAHQAPATPAK